MKEAVPLVWGSCACEVAGQTLPLSPQAEEMLSGTSWAALRLPHGFPTRSRHLQAVGRAHVLSRGTATSPQLQEQLSSPSRAAGLDLVLPYQPPNNEQAQQWSLLPSGHG